MSPDRGMYIALAASIIALVMALWAVWEARAVMDRADATAARLDPIETARADDAGRLDALTNEVEELARRLSELEQTATQPQPAEPQPAPAE